MKTLLPHHLAALAARWIPPELADAAGLYSVDSHDGGALVGRNGRGDYSGIAIPYKRRDGSIREYRLRRDNPDFETGADGKLRPKAKYLSPLGVPVLTYDPPDAANCKPDTPLIVVEGEFKALSLWRLAIHETDTPRWRPIGLQGCWNWRGTVDTVATPDGKRANVKSSIVHVERGQSVFLLPDTNYGRNRDVTIAWRQFGRHCQKQGADVRIIEVPAEEGVNGIDDFLARHGAAAGLALIEKAKPFDKPIIYVCGGSLAENVTAAEEYLADATIAEPQTGVYQRSGQLVHVARLENASESAGIRRPAGSLQILTASPDYIRMRLADAIKWLKHRRREDDWIRCDPPADIATSLIAIVGDWPRIPHLTAIIQAPALRPDGTLLQTPGYDVASGLYFDSSTEFPRILDNPTRADAEAAVALLHGVIDTFPYIDVASKSVMLAAMITPLCRHAMRSAPLFGFSAPAPGSGKTLQSYLPAYIATGLPPRLFSLPESVEESKKRYLAMLAEGAPVTVIDNVERPLKDDALCSILTEPAWSERILGSNRTLTVSTATTWLATGNALRVDGDLSSRTLLCSIDPAVERPEERKFAVDLHTEIPRRRGELAAAALTIVRAYLSAGRPKRNIQPFGRFEDWSRLVREPLVWLGCADPCDTRTAVQARDTVRENLSALLSAWHGVFRDDGQTVSEVLSRLGQLQELTCPQQEELQRLDSAIRAVAAVRGQIEPQRLGTYLARYERRIEDGLRFIRGPAKKNKAVIWHVFAGAGRESRESRESVSPLTRENGKDPNIYRHPESDSEDSRDSLKMACVRRALGIGPWRTTRQIADRANLDASEVITQLETLLTAGHGERESDVLELKTTVRMTADKLVKQNRSVDARIQPESRNRVTVLAPKGSITAQFREALAENDIINELSVNADLQAPHSCWRNPSVIPLDRPRIGPRKMILIECYGPPWNDWSQTCGVVLFVEKTQKRVRCHVPGRPSCGCVINVSVAIELAGWSTEIEIPSYADIWNKTFKSVAFLQPGAADGPTPLTVTD